MSVTRLAWRNFMRNRSRYRVLILAITLVMATLVLVTGALLGVTEAVRSKAARYFSGHVAIQSFVDTGSASWIRDPAEVERVIENLPFPIVAYTRRSIYYSSDATLFFSGNYINQRRLVGVEWDLEQQVLGELGFLSGGLPSPDDPVGAVISSTTARDLQVQVGDQLIVSLTTRRGYRNTGELIVRGIYAESSFFGYTTYLPRETLNLLYGYAPDEVSEIGVYVARTGLERRIAFRVHEQLSGQAEAFPVFETREQRDNAVRGAWEGRKYAILTLGAQLAEINDLLSALSLVTMAIVILFLGIVAIGVSNTYSMIVFERTNEIGTLRSLGLTRLRTVTLFLSEAAVMGGVATSLGIGLGVLALLGAAAAISLPGQGVASLFLTQGRLSWSLPAYALAGVAATGVLSTTIGAIKPAIHASLMRPVDALRQE